MGADDRAAGLRRVGGGLTFAAMIAALLAPTAASSPSSANTETSSPPAQVAADRDPASPYASPFCMQRFFEPFAALTSDDLEGSVKKLTEVANADGQLRVSEKTEASITDDWMSRLASARDAIIQRFGPGRTRVEVIIATLPDPVDSGLGYQFDVQLQALQHGIEAAPGSRTTSPVEGFAGSESPTDTGTAIYNRANSWLPWDDRVEDGSKRANAVQCRSQLPGVMLFRSSDLEHPSVLVALLVGETPTAGVHTRAMNAALEADIALRGVSASSRKPGVTRILGPAFSGAALSLRQALQQRPCGERCSEVQIISGTANGPDVPTLLSGGPEPQLRHVTYQTTTLPESRLACSYLHFVNRLGVGDGGGEDETTPGPQTRLDGVAILQELGTEFGGSSRATHATHADPDCKYTPERYLSFPFHVSRIRDAYEKADKSLTQGERDPGIARHTSLPASLQEPTLPLDLQAQASPLKTTNAQDLALAHVLGAISREGIRYVAIEATDTGDAIFLARKIRDVAPDVRIAFFSADALLLHPSFRHDLLGSLVVSPYPFLGAADLAIPLPQDGSQPGPHRDAPFESDGAEATFNAALALRGAPVSALMEYDFVGANDREHARVALPVWVSAIGRAGLAPLYVRRSRDCEGNIYGRAADDESQDEVCGRKPAGPDAGHDFDLLRGMQLHLDRDVTPPRLWQFVFAMLALLTWVDIGRMRTIERTLAVTHIPHEHEVVDDRRLDLAFGRMKWTQYATIRAAALTLMLAYLVVTTAFALRTYTLGLDVASGMTWLLLAAGTCSVVRASGYAITACRRYYADQCALGRLCQRWIRVRWQPARSFSPLVQLRALGQYLSWQLIGFENLCDLKHIVYSSYVRLRSSSCFIAFVLGGIASGAIVSLIDTGDTASLLTAAPRATLFTLRNLSLLSGLSASTPLLLALMCIYAWTIAGMRRVRASHALSRMTPDDGVCDGAATPISSILFPTHADAGFSYHERALTNPILRLNTMSRYMVVLVASVVVPMVVFILKPPNALEPVWDGRFLFMLLAVCGLMISTNLLQFYEHWRALAMLLDRLETHPLASAFRRVLAFARAKVDTQITHEPNDLARTAVCAEELAQLLKEHGGEQPLQREAAAFRAHCMTALEEQAERPGGERAAELEAVAGSSMIESARELMRVLQDTPDTQLPRWSRRAEGYIATVIALVINRHLRQVSPFLWGTTVCVMLLLAAIISYPFEPHRALLTCIWIITAAVVGLGMYVFVALDRDTLLSRIARRAPGQITFDRALLGRVMIWVVMPMLAVVAAQYPQVAELLGPLVDPISRTLR